MFVVATSFALALLYLGSRLGMERTLRLLLVLMAFFRLDENCYRP